MVQNIRPIMFLSIIICLFAGCATYSPLPTKRECVVISRTDNYGAWEVGHEARDEIQSISEFVRKGETVENWNELFTIHEFSYVIMKRASLDEDLELLKALREKNCPNSTTWNIISRDDNSILYEWRAKPCLGWPDQHEIARIMDGKYTRFLIRYTAKVKELPEDKRNEWINCLSKAYIKEIEK